MNNYFSGEGGLRNYAKPAFEKMIPLVELPSSLNPFLKKYGIHINAKLMNRLLNLLPAIQLPALVCIKTFLELTELRRLSQMM